LPDEEIEEQRFDQKRKIGELITFCSHFYDVVLPFVLTQTAQPLHEDIINITLSIVILGTTPPV
jgi:hypothetical protein